MLAGQMTSEGIGMGGPQGKKRHKKPWGYKTAAFGFWLQPCSFLRPPGGDSVSACGKEVKVQGSVGLRKKVTLEAAWSSSSEAQQWHLPGRQREPEFARQPARLQSGLVTRTVTGQGFITRLGKEEKRHLGRFRRQLPSADCSITGQQAPWCPTTWD